MNGVRSTVSFLSLAEAVREVNDIGEISSRAIYEYFRDPVNIDIIKRLKEAGVNMELKDSGIVDEKLSLKLEIFSKQWTVMLLWLTTKLG